MRAQPLKILVVEGGSTYTSLLQVTLAEMGNAQLELAHVEGGRAALRHLTEAQFDVILLDLAPSDGDELDTLVRIHAQVPDVPVVALMSSNDEILAAEAVRAGAQDCLTKGQFDGRLLVHALRYAAERNRAEQALRESERRYRQLIEEASDVIYTTDAYGYCTYVNPPGQRITGYSRDEILGMHFTELIAPEWQERVASFYLKQFQERVRETIFEFPIITKAGEERWVEQTVTLLADGDWVAGFQSIVRDITERKQAEVDLVAQKQLFESLVAVSRAAAERPALEPTLKGTLDVVASITGAEIGCMFLVDEAGALTHSILVRQGTELAQRRDRANLVMEKGLAGWVARHRRSVLLEDTVHDERWLSLSNGSYVARSALAVPIARGPVLLGVLTLTHSSPGHFDDEHLRLMQAAADQMAMALRKAQMYEEQGRLAARQTTLYEVLRTVGGHLESETIARAAVEVIARLTGWPDVVILLPDETAGRLVIRARAGRFAEAEGRSVSVDRGITGRAFRTAQTQHVPDISSDPDYVAGHPAVRSELAVPLQRGGLVLGVLNVDSDQSAAFDADDVLMAESLAEAIALALENAQLYTAIQQELTERKRAEKALQESEIKHRLLLSSIRSPVLALGEDMTVLYCNEAYAEFVGKSAVELEGQNLLELFPELEKTASFTTYRKVLATGEPDEAEGRLGDRYLHARVYRTPWGILALAEDITERRRREEELRQAKDAAEAASRAKSTFLANISHELRTPLNAIIGYGELLQEEAADLGYANLVPDLKKIATAGHQLLTHINDLLDFSKIEVGKMEFHLDTFDVAALVESVVAAGQPLAVQNGNTLQVHCPGDIGPMHADRTKVRQILLNLLSNAAKFTKQGHITFTVAREPAAEGVDWISFRVTDTGIGMTPEQLLYLFQPFTQTDATTTRQHGGSGLGLAISQRFCQMMGGEISVESEVGKGTTFTVRLPAAGPAAISSLVGRTTEQENMDD